MAAIIIILAVIFLFWLVIRALDADTSSGRTRRGGYAWWSGPSVINVGHDHVTHVEHTSHVDVVSGTSSFGQAANDHDSPDVASISNSSGVFESGGGDDTAWIGGSCSSDGSDSASTFDSDSGSSGSFDFSFGDDD